MANKPNNILVVGAGATGSVLINTLAKNKKNMTEKWKNIKILIDYSKCGIISKELKKNGKINLTLFCMAKDTTISEHTSTKEGFVYVLEGKGIFNLQGENIAMMPGVIIFLPKNAVHSLEAKKNTSFLLALFNVL